MSRPREVSGIDTYHIIMKGVGEMNVFECKADREKFLSLLKYYCEKLGVLLISYVLLDSHIHLQVKVSEVKSYSNLVHRLCITYVQHYFNPKYDRKGSLFQSRFVSEAVDSGEGMREMVRYMVLDPRNGVKYKYSSFKESVRCYGEKKAYLIDKGEFLKVFPDRSEFISLMTSKAPKGLKKEFYPMNTQEVSEYIRREGKLNHCLEFMKMDESEQKRIVIPLIENKVSWKKISGITHMSVYRLKKVAGRG